MPYNIFCRRPINYYNWPIALLAGGTSAIVALIGIFIFVLSGNLPVRRRRAGLAGGLTTVALGLGTGWGGLAAGDLKLRRGQILPGL